MARSDDNYDLLTVDSVPSYVASQPNLASRVDASTLAVREVGDGNLNLVFVARDASGSGVCLKQSLPYVRLVGESWPLTPHRVVAESRSLEIASLAAPRLVPESYGFDRDRFILAMEDLSDWAVWRTALNDGDMHVGVAAQIGEYVARMTFATSVFGRPAEAVRRSAAESTNPDLCRITEDLVFTEPYSDHEHNSYAEALSVIVEGLRADASLLAEVDSLKYRFMTAAQALVHGDLHTGSVMVAADGNNPARGKVIDPEFCFFGPIGFDLGALFGNYLIAHARAAALPRPSALVEWLGTLPSETWDGFTRTIRRLWSNRVDGSLSDGFLESWFRDVWVDAVGYGGCKAIRRIVGLAKASDIETLPPSEHISAATIVLRTARKWILERHQLTSPSQLFSVVSEEASGVVP